MRNRRSGELYLWWELSWFIRLRWLAGAAVVAAGLLHYWQPNLWTPTLGYAVWVGLGILIYNVALMAAHKRMGRHGASLQVQVWLQILLDLASLTMLVLWTGRLSSPLMGFFVFHMVFASILMTRLTANAVAAIAVVMVAAAMGAVGAWPSSSEQSIVMIGWITLLFLTVYLAGHVTKNLKRQRLRALQRSRRVRRISDDLRQNQHAMIQHEKSVALGRMAAGLAHEIANPLANMDSLLQLVQRRPERMDEQTTVKLRDQIARIRQIIDRMSRFAHPTEQAWETCSVKDLIEVALAMVNFDRRWKKVKLETRLNEPPCVFQVQPHAFEQVLVNVLINAMDAMADSPEPRIVISSQCDGQWCRVRISDNGHGIKDKDRGHVFDAFFTTKPVGAGTGLGLAISRELLRNQGGEIDLHNNDGPGVTVTIKMPNRRKCSTESAR